MRKLIILVVALVFVSSAICAFAEKGTCSPGSASSQGPASQKSIFQEASNGMADWGKPEGGRRPISDIFQSSSNCIKEKGPVAKQQNLRQNREELRHRRGMRGK